MHRRHIIHDAAVFIETKEPASGVIGGQYSVADFLSRRYLLLTHNMKSTLHLTIYYRILSLMLLTVFSAPTNAQTTVQPSCGLTIITHGYQPEDSPNPIWVTGMAKLISAKAGNVPIYTLACEEKGDGDKSLVLSSEGNRLLDTTSHGGAVICLDWARVASAFWVEGAPAAPEHTTQEVADAVFDYIFLQRQNWLHPNNPTEVPIHLIGHSRGGSLVSRLAFRLAEYGILVDQMTTLDPHPLIATYKNDWPLTCYTNTLFCDNYFRADGGVESYPEGHDFPGTASTVLDGFFPGFGSTKHSYVHTYYNGTIPLSWGEGLYAIGDGTYLVDTSWYSGDGRLPRSETGYSYSRFGTTMRPAQGVSQWIASGGGSGLRTTIPSTSMLWPNVAFDQRKRVAVAGSETATMAYLGETLTVPYWFINRSSSQAVTFFLDDDTNPYNGSGTELGTVENAASGGIIGIGNFNFVVQAAHAGTHYVGALVRNNPVDFRVRYDYLFSPITIAPGSSLVVSPADPFSTSGPIGGPFSPSSTTYTLSNQGNSSISWTATDNADWLNLSSAGATIPSNSFTTLTASLNSSAISLSPGTHAATITITGPGDPVELLVTLRVFGPSSIWTNRAGGSWVVGANWLGATIPSGAGVTADFSTLNLAADATVTLDGGRTIGGLKFGDTTPNNNWTINAGTGDLLTLDVTTGSPTITVTNQTTTIGAVVAGTRGLTKEGAGTLVLSRDTIYSGSTMVRQGALILGGTYAATEYSVLSGAVLEFNVVSSDYGEHLTATAFTGSGVIRKTGAGGLYWGYSSTTFGMASGSLIDLQEGWIIGGSYNNEVWTDNKADLNVSSGAIFDGVEAAIYVDALMGSGTIQSGFPGYASMITFGVDNGSGTFSGVLKDSYAPGNFVKTGTGTQILSGASTYTGTTIINSGKLLANNITGSATGASTVTVKTTATLGGTGAVSGAVTVESGGTLSPGESEPNSLSVGALTLGASSRVAFDLSNWSGSAGSGYDSINATSLNIAATAANPVTVVVKLQSLLNFSNASRSFVLISSPGGITGFAADKFEVDASAFDSGDGQWDVQVSGTNLMLVYAAGGTPPSNAKPVISGITTPVRLTDGRIGLGFTAIDAENNAMTCYIALRKSDGATYVGNSNTLKRTIPSGANTVYFTPEELAGMTGLASGSYQVRVRVLDAIHNTGQTCAEAFSPFFTITMPNQAPVIGQVGSPVQVGDGKIRCGFTATDPENNNMTCNIALRKADGSTYVGNSDVPKGNISSGANTLEFSLAEIANMTGLMSGSYQVRVRVFDAAHNTSATCAQAFSGYFTYAAPNQPPVFAYENYGAWANANAPGQTTDQDHDHDGVPNGIEYFMGKTGSDFTANSGIAADGTATWPKSPAFSGSYAVQTSADLVEWTDVTEDAAQVTKNSDSVVWTRPIGPESRFVRLLVMPN